jgi:DNA-binding NarL/FixJ family response regulator
LTAFAKDFAKREAELAGAGEELRAERDLEIRAASSGGLPEEAIARALKISQQRVSQILRN